MLLRERYIKVKDKYFYVCDKGKGEPIIFLHGGAGGTLDFFLPFAETLAEDYHVILYDQTGCGKSDEDEGEEYTVQNEVDYLEGLRKALNLNKVNLFGESWGSILALSYAAKYSKHTNKVLLTAVIGLSSTDYFAFKHTLLKKLGSLNKLKLVFYEILTKIGVKHAQVMQSEILDPFYVFSPSILEHKTHIQFNQKVHKHITEDIEKSLNLRLHQKSLNTLPILIAQGSHDILSPDYIRKNVMTYLTNAELVNISGSGHWTILEQPEKVTNITKKFI